MKLVYPIILYPMEEHEGGYTVEVPDLPGCVTEGHDLADALDMARDAASGWILDEMEDGRAVPHASNITDVKPDEPDGIVSLISLDMDAYAEKYGSKAVRKNVHPRMARHIRRAQQHQLFAGAARRARKPLPRPAGCLTAIRRKPRRSHLRAPGLSFVRLMRSPR